VGSTSSEWEAKKGARRVDTDCRLRDQCREKLCKNNEIGTCYYYDYDALFCRSERFHLLRFMKPLSIWLPLILIVSGSFLSATKSTLALTPTSQLAVRSSPTQKPANQASQTHTTVTPGALLSTNTPTGQPTHAIDGSSDSQTWNNWFWQNIATFLLVVVAIWAGWIATGTLDEISSQTLAATTAANAAKQSADTATQELIIANRAYLYLSAVQIVFDEARTEDPDSSPIYPYTITYPIYNGGQTPALYISAYARADTFERPPTNVSPAAIALDRPQNVIIPPRGAEPLRPPYNSSLSEEEFFKIRDHAWRLCFYGVLTYVDIFGKTERHTWFNLSFRAPFPEAGVARYMAFEAAGGLNRFD
jgi:hypothetical protein